MRLLFEIDTKDYDPNGKAFVRPSVRGIIIQDGKVAMVHSLKYDYYKFPGGGMEYGFVHRVQKGQKEAMFIQDNYYFLCEVEAKVGSQQLDDYEAEERFTLEYVNPTHAIRINREVDHGPKDQIMLEREAGVLEMMIQEGII